MDPDVDEAWGRCHRPSGGRLARFAAVGRGVLAAGRDGPTLSRWSLHASVVGLAVLAVVGSSGSGPVWSGSGAPVAQVPVMEVVALARQGSSRGLSGYLVRAAQPRTARSDTPTPASRQQLGAPAAARRGIQTYIVEPGDTVFDLAQRFGITPDTILSANPSLAGNPDLLKLGQELTILPVSGVLHEVRPGETLSSIAQEYKVEVSAIVAYPDNQLSEPYTLQVGQKLMVPGAKLPAPPAPRYAAAGAGNGRATIPATGAFMWPTTGRITQYPWWGHMAIDIGTATGTPIYAADAGYVLEAGWTNVGYGLYVVIDHGNGYRTLYGHMSAITAQAGQSVQKGQLIGRVGSTGNSTGPHLHFEVYQNGVLQDPLNYLP